MSIEPKLLTESEIATVTARHEFVRVGDVDALWCVKLLAHVAALNADRIRDSEAFPSPADRIANLEAERSDDRDFIDQQWAEYHAMRKERDALAARETSASIAAWQDETFGPATTTWERVNRSIEMMCIALRLVNNVDLLAPRPEPRPNLARALRAAEELAELITLLVANDADPKAPQECADIDIVLRGIDRVHGTERQVEVDRKMAINRARKWTLTGDGHGQHVEEP